MRENETNAADVGVQNENVRKEEPTGYEPKGVGGFLFLLAIILLLSPLKTILVDIPFSDADVLAQIPAMKVAVRVNQAALLVLSVFSLMAGYKLLKVARDAVKFTKHYLIVSALYPLVFPLIALALVGAPGRAYGSALGFYFMEVLSAENAIGLLIFTVVWYAYLCRSKRVRNTYGEGKAS